jgi:transposase
LRVCLNPRQARKDGRDGQAIIDSSQEKIKTAPKSLSGNKGYRKYLKIDWGSASIDQAKIEYESRFDGKWILTTNTDFSADQLALKYKELRQVEQVFRDLKSVLKTSPVYHQRDANIRGHVILQFSGAGTQERAGQTA